MEAILGKLKTCGILAVNQLASKEVPKRYEKGRSHFADKQNQQKSTRALDPLGNSSSGESCNVDSRHKCFKSRSCQQNWGLLGCSELYKLKSIEERVAYCKASKCCYVCGSSDLSAVEFRIYEA